MRRVSLVPVLLFSACSQMPSGLDSIGGWTTLIDGERGLENFQRVGDANWRVEDGAIVAYRGKGGYLVSKRSYKDFQLRAEFWADAATNSGIFIRVANPKRIGTPSANYAKVSPMPKTGGKWNTVEVTAKGKQLTVVLNGVQTVNIQHARFSQGPFALQYAAPVKSAADGPIKWRKVQIKPL